MKNLFLVEVILENLAPIVIRDGSEVHAAVGMVALEHEVGASEHVHGRTSWDLVALFVVP